MSNVRVLFLYLHLFLPKNGIGDRPILSLNLGCHCFFLVFGKTIVDSWNKKKTIKLCAQRKQQPQNFYFCLWTKQYLFYICLLITKQ